MKKLLLTLSIVLLLLGCGDEKLITINNYSDTQTIIFTITMGSRTDDYKIYPNAQSVFKLNEDFEHRMRSYQSYPVINSVYLVQEGDIYNFYDITPFPSSIYNTLGKDVLLYGNGAISTDPLMIRAGQEEKNETIKSKTPSFNGHTTDGYPVQVDFNFDGSQFKIILR